MGCGASQAARVEPEDQVQKNGSPSATSEKKEDSLKVDSPARQRFEEQPTKPGLRVPSLAGGLKTGSAELTSVQAFELKAQHSIIPRRDKSPSARHALPDSAEGLGPISPITRGPLPPVADGGSPARSTRFNSALRQRAPEDHLPGLPLGNEPLFVPSPVRRGSDATGSPLPSSRVPSNGLTARGSPASARNQRLSSNGTQAPTGILKANSRENGAMGGGRSVRAPGGRSIMFKDNNTFVFDRDASDEEDLTDHEYLDETDSCGLRIGPGPSFNPAMPLPDVRSRPSGAILTPMRLESLNDKLALSGLPPGHPHGLPHSEPLVDLASGLSFANARAGSQALLSKKGPLLPPSKMFKSGESQAAMGANLPPVKNSGHRSIGSRSIAGVRSEISFAIPNRDVTTPAMKGRSGPSVTVRHAPSRVESAVSSAGPESEADSEFPSGDDGDNGSHSKRYKHVRNGKEWDAKGARWRRASAFQSSAHCAISLRFLRKILTEYVVPLAQKLQVPLDKVTTLTVNEMIVKQLTMEEQCRLVDVPGLVPKEDVGEPDYFISHAWGNPFAHLVQCVCDHLSGALDSTKVWIDIAAVNQHPTEQQQDDLANLRNAIFKSKATLMCLDVTGAPLKRVWCLYECDNTITIHGPDRLVLLTPNFSVKDMASVFKSINVMDAGVYKQSDKDKIIEDIVAHHGSTTAFDNKLKLLFLLEPLDTQAELESLLEGTTGAHEYDFTPVQMWITSPRAPQVCVISGPAGSGKSTISAALCWDEDMQQRRQKAIARGQRVGSAKNAAAAGQVLLRQMSNLASVAKPTVHAYHFCKYSDVRRQSPIRIVKTLAYQLAQRLPLLRSYYAGLDLAQVLQLHQASTAFRLLLLKPLTTLLPRDEQIVVLIDAMDEADSHAQLPLDNSVLQLMLHQLSCLPRNVKIITSTRSAPHLMGPLRRKFHGALELTPSMVRKRESTLIQLERRLALRFGEASAKAAMSTGAGESNLVYYSVLMLVDPPLDKVPGSLQECYTVVFAAQWKQLTKAQQAEVVKVLQVLMAAREPLQLSLLAGLGLEHVLENLPGWGTLLYEREYKVYSLHKSLNDWLTDPAAGPYHADPRVGDATLGRYLFNAAHPLPSYGAKYLVSHLLAAGPKLKELLDQAVTDLDHLEAVCRVGYVFRLHQELAAAETKSRAVSDVVRWLGLNSHVLWAHPAAVVQLANEAPNNSAFMIALRRPRRSSTITTELMAAAGAAVGGGAVPHMGSGAPVTLLNKKRSWPAQLSILAQHHRAVNSVAFNPSGTLLVSGSEDKSVRVWDPLTGEQKAVLFGHTGQVLGVAFSSNGQLIASGSVDSTVRVWDASTGEEKCALDGHTDWVRDVAFSPGTSPGANGRWIASCGDDKTVRVWEVGAENPVLKYTLNGHTDVVYSLSFSPGGELLASGSADMSIRVWDPAAGRQSGRALVAHKFAVTAITFSPDGQWLASASHDKVILLWELAAARETGMPSAELTGHLDKILDLAYNPDGSQLVSASADGSLRIWDVPSRRVRGVLLGHASGVVAAAFSPSGAQVASAASDNTVRLWDPRIACENKSVEEASVSHMDCVTCVAFSPSGHTIASAGQDWTVRLWDPSDGNHRALLSGHTDVVRCVAFSPNGGLLASASSDWTVRLWDPVAGTEKALLQGHQDRVLSVTWSLNGRMLASACHDGCIIIWDAASFEKKIELKGHTAPVHTLAFAPSSKSLASGSADRTVRIWQPSLAEQQVMIKGHTGAVNVVEYDATGKLLASSSLEEKMVRVWDPASSMLLCVISNAGLCAAGAFSMYSLARHAPCVRAIALKQRISNSGAAPGGGNTSLSGGAPSVPAFGTSPSFTPHVLQPSMTMRMERNSPNGLVIGAHNSSTEINYNFVFNAAGGVTHSSGGGAPQSPTGTQAGGAHGNGSINGSTGTGTPPVLQTAMSMRSSLSTMDEIPRLMELVSEIDNPIVPIYTQFVSPKCVAVYRNKVVMSDGPHLYFFESNEGKIVGWKNRIQSAAT
ncbi:hypothetical protein HYH03_007264 [Edaphochlamys debaryana]|uniref:Nephrocystin 3-like N-terminal domain-containing protein n=1 Tax=Edaphochlamys debaryana TaxID=47281 RepID=A0A835Y8R6_9CHLO|nr:hypothetical protein HYH03_007264 [Edaphochlamys debaryana]|eukprot:KAG2494495.1 hypothetical protein HYH03_007264 [Edaphochlamys debaryana]